MDRSFDFDLLNLGCAVLGVLTAVWSLSAAYWQSRTEREREQIAFAGLLAALVLVAGDLRRVRERRPNR